MDEDAKSRIEARILEFDRFQGLHQRNKKQMIQYQFWQGLLTGSSQLKHWLNLLTGGPLKAALACGLRRSR